MTLRGLRWFQTLPLADRRQSGDSGVHIWRGVRATGSDKDDFTLSAPSVLPHANNKKAVSEWEERRAVTCRRGSQTPRLPLAHLPCIWFEPFESESACHTPDPTAGSGALIRWHWTGFMNFFVGKKCAPTVPPIWWWSSCQSCHRTSRRYILPAQRQNLWHIHPAPTLKSHSQLGGATAAPQTAGTSVASHPGSVAPWSAASPWGWAATGWGSHGHCSSGAAHWLQSSAAGCGWPSTWQGGRGGWHGRSENGPCRRPAPAGHQMPLFKHKQWAWFTLMFQYRGRLIP